MSRHAAGRSLQLAALLSLACALPAHAQLLNAHNPTSLELFGGLEYGAGRRRLGARTIAQARGRSSARARRVLSQRSGRGSLSWRFGFDFTLFPIVDQPLRPYGQDGGASISGALLDIVAGARPSMWLAPGLVELQFSAGLGISTWLLEGRFPLTAEDGSTEIENVGTTTNWGPLAQVGIGATFWLSPRYAVLIELQALARQTNAVVQDANRGDYLIQINDLQARLLIGLGAVLGKL